MKWVAMGAATVLAAVVLASMLWLVIGIPDNQRIKKEMSEFCGSFRAGSRSEAADILARAKVLGYEASAGRWSGEASAVVSRAYSRTGTRWTCTVVLQGGQVREAQFKGNSLAD